SVGSGGQTYAPGQLERSSCTNAPLSGLFARSRTTTTRWMSPSGQVTRQGGNVEFAGDGTPADATEAAASSVRARSSGAIRFMRASRASGIEPDPGRSLDEG